jgi:hypothetical protein
MDYWPAETFLLSDDWANKVEEARVGKRVGESRHLGRLVGECIAPFSSIPPSALNARTEEQDACTGMRGRGIESISHPSRIFHLFSGKIPGLN